MIKRHLKRILSSLLSNDYQTLNLVTVSQTKVLHNLALMQRRHPHTAIMPVLKGNAYGHGLVAMAKILNDADCAFIAVDGYFEAAKIRDLTKHRILVLGYILPANAHLLDTKRCSFVVQDIAGLHALGRLKRPVRIHMELNTGMNRLGLQPAEITPYLETLQQFPNLKLEGIMTHLADADNENDESFTHAQVATFDKVVEDVQACGFHPRFIHVAQTAGSTKVVSRYANAMRLGIGLYGINPLNKRDPHYPDLAALKPVLELTSTIVKVVELQPNDKVGYNGTFTARQPMRLGILPLGYYEGLPYALSNRGVITSGAQTLSIVGRVCMNHTMIDLTGTTLAVGDRVTIVSSNPAAPNSVVRISEEYDVVPYTFLAGLSGTIRRQIV